MRRVMCVMELFENWHVAGLCFSVLCCVVLFFSTVQFCNLLTLTCVVWTFCVILWYNVLHSCVLSFSPLPSTSLLFPRFLLLWSTFFSAGREGGTPSYLGRDDRRDFFKKTVKEFLCRGVWEDNILNPKRYQLKMNISLFYIFLINLEIRTSSTFCKGFAKHFHDYQDTNLNFWSKLKPAQKIPDPRFSLLKDI